MNSSHPPGVVSKLSPHSVPETFSRLKDIVTQKGMTLFAEIDHQANAEQVGLHMQAAHVLIFGNARAGTPLMVASPLLALELPLRVLIWQDADGSVWASYYSPAYLGELYSIPHELIKNIAGIDALVDAALQP